jgi:hypothetical protein
LGCVGTTHEVIVGSTIYAMDPLNGAVVARSLEGDNRVVFTAGERVQITEGLHDALRRDLPAQSIMSGAPADTIESALQRLLPIGASLPTWTTMIADPSGRLWLRVEECSATPDEGQHYDVVSVEGELEGRVSVPSSSRLLAVRGNLALIVRRDELEVEHLELYEIHAEPRVVD